MRSIRLALAVTVLSSLACFGGPDQQAEIDTLHRQMAEKDAALTATQSQITAMEATMKACGCKPPPPPSPVVTTPSAPAPAVAAAPAPVAVAAGFGEVEIKSPPSFRMILDGKVMSYNMLKSVYVAKDVASGAHRIEVQIGTSDIIHSESIGVEAGKRTRYQWKELPARGTDQLEQLATVDVD